MKDLYNKHKHLFNDESFILWFLGKEDDEWDRWKNNKQEHAEFVEFAGDFLRELKPKEKQISKTDKVYLWREIENKIATSQKIKKLSFRIWAQSAAALILILISLGLFHLNGVQVKCLQAQHIQHYLPDSSLVELNSGSELSYNKLMWTVSRNVHMKGEAYFKVKKGKTFTVKANTMQVSVLGTSFNVYAYADEHKVDCFTGKVAVEFDDFEQGALLTKGMGVLKHQDKLDRYIHKENKAPLWTKGEFYFNNASYLRVFDELERQFDLRILNKKSFANRTYTGSFTNANMETAFNMVLSPISCRAQQKGNTIVIVEE